MENEINIRTFIQQLTYYIKMGIYVNKGTDKDSILERCIKLYNKYKKIESLKEIGERDETFVRKCLKRFNLILKIDSDGKPVDIKNKESQINMVFFQGHPSLADNDINSMIEFATTNNIDIFTEIPLIFILRESKYQELLWQYTRVLFYISQLLICRVPEDADSSNKIIIEKQKHFDEAAEKLENIFLAISDVEEKIKMNQVMALDKFLKNRLIETEITDHNVNEARQEVKEIFQKKGLGENNSMTSLIDKISDQLQKCDIKKGNIIQNMLGIAQNVAQEMKGELENNPEQFQNTLGAISEVFKEAMDDGTKNGDKVPDELKNMFNTLVSAVPGSNGQECDEEIAKNLENIIKSNGLDREEFFSTIKGENGEIDPGKLEDFLTNLESAVVKK